MSDEPRRPGARMIRRPGHNPEHLQHLASNLEITGDVLRQVAHERPEGVRQIERAELHLRAVLCELRSAYNLMGIPWPEWPDPPDE